MSFAELYQKATTEPDADDGAEATAVLGSPRGGAELSADRRESGRPAHSKSIGEAVARRYGTN